MFKRLREGLFRRPDEQETQEQETQEQADEQIQEASEPTTAPEVIARAVPAEAPSRPVAPVPPPASSAPASAAAPIPPAAPVPPAAPSLPTATPPIEQEISDVEDTELEEQPERGGRFRNPFRFSLGRTRQLFGRLNESLESDEITDDFWDELEETLITGDVGVTTSERLLATLRERVAVEHIERGTDLREALKEELLLLLGDPEPLVVSDTSPISVYLVVGVNGVGKTTSIAKLAYLLKRQKRRVMLAAGDTFRAAATEQLKTWGERVGVPVISHQHGADPGAVVYDAMQAAQARGTEILIVDTAGRLHTKFNLMEELKKIMRVLQKYDPEAPHEVLLVIDATTGQNGFLQAKQFVQDAGVSGVVLTKLDSTARGGIAFAIASELGLPIKFVGTGESLKDLAPFDADEFVDALFED